MKNIRKFKIVPALTKRLEPLREIADNIWWTWNKDAINLFRRVDEPLWIETYHNPIKMINLLPQTRVAVLERDESFLANLDEVMVELETYMRSPTWYSRKFSEADGRFAYFSMEYGLHESMQIYSGGLGVLAGDHLKSASDIGLPLVAVGLFYHNGYFQQYLNADGWQQEYYPDMDYSDLPVKRVLLDNGEPLRVTVDLAGTTVALHVLKVQVGRVSLFLLDSNIDENSEMLRDLTAKLYGGDSELRMKQEIILGIGGVRALKAMGYNPSVFHLNEGHAGFLAIERIRALMEEKGLSFDEAREATAASSLFTTHTPVPAGFDLFDAALMDKYFRPTYQKLGLDHKSFMALGRFNPHDDREPMNMAVLGLRLSGKANGVAKLHGVVSRNLFKGLFPDVPESEIPIGHITNGIHVPTWLSMDMEVLYDRYFGPGWKDNPTDYSVWDRVESIPDGELWRTHERRRERLVAWARMRLARQLKRRGAPQSEIDAANEVLDPEALTIGFARRFATYKRATLLFSDMERIKRIVNATGRPVQFIFAGKAHPKDNPGKEFIQKIVRATRDPELRRRVLFIENYDINVARYLTSGVDIWLNTPRRPREASGTSGMKVPINGGINLSIMDGWWDEGFTGNNGWAIGAGEDYDNEGHQDYVESHLLYELLEKELVPMFYKRGVDQLPRDWIKVMKNSMRTCGSFFNSNRQVQEYAETYYIPLSDLYEKISVNEFSPAKELAAWKMHVYRHWPQIRIGEVTLDTAKPVKVGEVVPAAVQINLGSFSPNDVCVEVWYGKLDANGQVVNPTTALLTADKTSNNVTQFKGKLPCEVAGQYGYSVRVTPKHPLMAQRFIPGLIHWQD